VHSTCHSTRHFDVLVLAGTVLGVALLLTFAISIGAIVQKNHVTIGLVLLNYALLLDAMGVVVIGTFVWFFTLQERANFHRSWLQADRQTRIMLQDQVCFKFIFPSCRGCQSLCSSNAADTLMEMIWQRSEVRSAGANSLFLV
jgi:hypothetical protein